MGKSGSPIPGSKDAVRRGCVLGDCGGVPGGGGGVGGASESATSRALDHIVKHVHGLHDVFILQVRFKKKIQWLNISW